MSVAQSKHATAAGYVDPNMALQADLDRILLQIAEQHAELGEFRKAFATKSKIAKGALAEAGSPPAPPKNNDPAELARYYTALAQWLQRVEEAMTRAAEQLSPDANPAVRAELQTLAANAAEYRTTVEQMIDALDGPVVAAEPPSHAQGYYAPADVTAMNATPPDDAEPLSTVYREPIRG